MSWWKGNDSAPYQTSESHSLIREVWWSTPRYQKTFTSDKMGLHDLHLTCVWLAGIFDKFHRQGGRVDSNVYTYIKNPPFPPILSLLAKNVMLAILTYLSSAFRKIADVNQNMIQKNHSNMMYLTICFFPIMLSLSPIHKFFKSHLWCLVFYNHKVYCDACDVLQVTCIILDWFFIVRGGGKHNECQKCISRLPPH